MKKRGLLPLLVAVLAFASNLGATGTPSPLALAAQKAANGLPAGGLVLAEIAGNEVRYTTGGDLPARAEAPQQLIFEIGSITKVFTGLLLAQATLDGKAALSDPISKFLPADLKLDPSVAAITLEQLASHTSGLPRLPDNLQPANPTDPYADYTEARLYAFLRSHKLDQPAPRPAEYSNLGVGLLGHLISRAYNRSYPALVTMYITRPLGMDDTAVALSSAQKNRFVAPHSGSMLVLPWLLDALEGAGALRSSAADMAKFVQALCDPDSPIAAAWAIAKEPRASFAGGHVGLCVMMLNRDGETIYHHGGGTGGFRSYFEVTPAQRRGVVLLINNDTFEPGTLVSSVLRPVALSPQTTRAEISLSAAQLAEYAGVYDIDGRARFTAVLDDNGQLRMRLTGQAFLPIFASGNDRFFSKAVAAEFQFARNDQGQVQRVTLHQNGREVPARRTGPAPAIRFPSTDKLREYAGSYELGRDMAFDVSATPASLVVKLTGQPAFPVHNTREDHFVYDIVDAALTFERDAGGKVVALVLHQNGMNQRAPRKADK